MINVPCVDQPIQTKASHPYFIVVTSNEERLLPKAFLRRCAVLELQIPEEKSEAIALLMDIYTTHYPAAQSESDLNEAKAEAEKVISQRNTQNDDDYFAGTSEFLDMIKALREYPENERNSVRLALLSKHLVEKTRLRG